MPLLGESHSRFGRLEERLEDLEDELSAHMELDHAAERVAAEFVNLELERIVEVELAALKKEVDATRSQPG